jgi:HSP20 family protein
MGDIMLKEPGRLFRDLWDEFMDWTGRSPDRAGRSIAPAIDVRAQDDRYLVEADLPGLDRKDIDFRVDEDTLTISSDKEEKTEEKDEGYIRRERYSRSFRRSFRLPDDVDREKIDAEFQNGVVTVTLPRTGEKKSVGRQIEVKG